jgi:hypothetical protein
MLLFIYGRLLWDLGQLHSRHGNGYRYLMTLLYFFLFPVLPRPSTIHYRDILSTTLRSLHTLNRQPSLSSRFMLLRTYYLAFIRFSRSEKIDTLQSSILFHLYLYYCTFNIGRDPIDIWEKFFRSVNLWQDIVISFGHHAFERYVVKSGI